VIKIIHILRKPSIVCHAHTRPSLMNQSMIQMSQHPQNPPSPEISIYLLWSLGPYPELVNSVHIRSHYHRKTR